MSALNITIDGATQTLQLGSLSAAVSQQITQAVTNSAASASAAAQSVDDAAAQVSLAADQVTLAEQQVADAVGQVQLAAAQVALATAQVALAAAQAQAAAVSASGAAGSVTAAGQQAATATAQAGLATSSQVAATAQATAAQLAAQQSAAAGRAYATTALALADGALAVGASFSAPLADGTIQTYAKTSSSLATAIGSPFIGAPQFLNIYQAGFAGPYPGYLSAVIDELSQIIEGINLAGQKENWLQCLFMQLATFSAGVNITGPLSVAGVSTFQQPVAFQQSVSFASAPSFQGSIGFVDDGTGAQFSGWWIACVDTNNMIIWGIDKNLNFYSLGTEARLETIEANVATTQAQIAVLQGSAVVGGYADSANWSAYSDAAFAVRTMRKSDGTAFLLSQAGDQCSTPIITADQTKVVWRSKLQTAISADGLVYRAIDASAPQAPAITQVSIAAWGDSMTQGVGSSSPNTYCEYLAALTGHTVFNGGIGGQTSTQIAAHQGALPMLVTLTGNVIPGTGAAVALTAWSVPPTNTNGPQVFTGTVLGIPVTLTRTSGSGADAFSLQQNPATGVDLAVPANTPFVISTGGRDAWTTVIYSGYNGGNILSDITAMVNFLKPLNKRFLVLSIPSGSTPYGSSDQQIYNNQLAAAFPQNYADLRSYLVAQYNPNIPQDVIDHGNNIVPSSIVSSQPHLNAAGQLAQATFVYNQLVARGWV